MPNRHRHPGLPQAGFTLLEVLIVLAIIAVVLGIVVMSGRPIVDDQADHASVRTVQQSVWQGATVAASRGVRTQLVYTGSTLEVRRADNGEMIRSFELPSSASLNAPPGTLLEFTPPGKVDEASLSELPSPFQIEAGGRITSLEVSLIGEVRTVGGS